MTQDTSDSDRKFEETWEEMERSGITILDSIFADEASYPMLPKRAKIEEHDSDTIETSAEQVSSYHWYQRNLKKPMEKHAYNG